MDPRLILGAAAIAVAASGGKRKKSAGSSGQKRSPDATLLNPSTAMKAIDLREEEWPDMVFSIPFAAGSPKTLWPLVTDHSRKYMVSYLTVRGDIVGNGARRFMARRGEKYHVGIDLYARHGDTVLAMESGTIVNLYHFFHGAWAMIVQCDSGLVINYAEVERNSWKQFGLGKGSKVKRGQPIAKIGTMSGGSSMLHFETYMPPTKSNKRFFGGDAGPILNPTYYLLRARFLEEVGGRSFSGTDCAALNSLNRPVPEKFKMVEAEEDVVGTEPSDSVLAELLVDDDWRPLPDRADGP